MAFSTLKVVVVGAASLLGKELSEEVAASPLQSADIRLFDTETAEGQMTNLGDEAAFIRPLNDEAFDGADFAFFAGDRKQARAYWQAARRAGAMVVDLTGALAGEPQVMVWSPWVLPLPQADARHSAGTGLRRPDLETSAIVPAHPVATALALLVSRLARAGFAPQLLAATVLQPASELGSAGLDELHQQTVSLLSFKDLPQTVFDAQTAFNVLSEFGEEAGVPMSQAAGEMRAGYEALRGDGLPELSLQLLQVPVFHGYTLSVFLEFAQETAVADVELAIAGGRVQVAEAGSLPSNLLAAGQGDLLVSVTADRREGPTRRLWMCVAADNLKLAAANAIECALSMRSLRPKGKVQ